MLDEHGLGGGGTALHSVHDDDVRAGVHAELDVVKGARGADLDVDGDLPVGDLAQFLDLDREIVRPGPVRMPAGGSLIHALGQRAHAGDALVDLLAEQHAAAARLGALADDDLDRVGLAQVVGIKPVARGQALVHERLRRLPFFRRHAAVAGGGGRSAFRRGTAKGLLHVGGQRSEAHSRDGDRDLELDRLFRVAGAEHGLGRALLAVTLQRIARNRSGEKDQVVEMGHLSLGAQSANFVKAGRSSTLYVIDDRPIEGVALFLLYASMAHVVCPLRDQYSWFASAFQL